MKRRFFLRRMAVLAAAGAATGWNGVVQTANAGAMASNPLFGRTLPDARGQEFALDQWLGKPVVVNFWATWCPPCVKEMPDLEALHKKYDSVHFLGLGVDTASNVLTFTQKVKVSYPLLLIGHAGIELMRTLGNTAGGLPFTVIFDAQGRVKDTVLGQIKVTDLEKTLQGMLA